jgi:hypothetical protein
MKFSLKAVSLLILITLAVSSCKKYPENKLWFKKPERVFKGGKITMYTINGVDQMPSIRAMYNTFPYNYFGKAIPDVFDLTLDYESGGGNLTTEYGEGAMTFSKKGKDVTIQFNQKNQEYGAVNMFVAPMSWKILKLTKEGQMKIQGLNNYKLYVIQFN